MSRLRDNSHNLTRSQDLLSHKKMREGKYSEYKQIYRGTRRRLITFSRTSQFTGVDRVDCTSTIGVFFLE